MALVAGWLATGPTGCAGGGPTSAADVDPLTWPARPLAVETLPGGVPLRAALVVRGPDGFVVPWQAEDGVHLRVVPDGNGAHSDRLVDAGGLLGVAPLADGVAVAIAAADGGIRLHALRGARDDLQVIDAATAGGRPVPALASDGARLLVATVQGGEIAVETPLPMTARLLVADGAAVRAFDLGRVPCEPSLSGDARGFVAGGTLLVTDAGVAAAPGSQIGDARLFRRPLPIGGNPTRDDITLDGAAWLPLPGLVGWAQSTGAPGGGARLDLVDGDAHQLVEVGPDLTWRGARPLPSTRLGDDGRSWVAAADDTHVVWASAEAGQPVLALLDADLLQPDQAVGQAHGRIPQQPIVRLPDVRPGSLAMALTSTRLVMAWLPVHGSVRQVVIDW